MNPPASLAVEEIAARGQALCYIVRPAELPRSPVFPAPADLPLQAGFIAYPAGHEIPRHVHLPIPRSITGTAEVLLVLRGRCEVDIYDDERALVASRDLVEGDVMIMVTGGHGFRMTEDTVLFEVKQGPYLGPNEKERF
jgi:hypothetical protein